ncbi:hypothetical protein GLYMA_04G158702v4 [Glycine max]|nr:hypothetical protein GLYMA_04G158702v4 [Glycine max]KAH1111578.1 hypothetical protein GYH30_010101 [Glycine max]
MILGIWKLWTQTKLSSQVEANQMVLLGSTSTPLILVGVTISNRLE